MPRLRQWIFGTIVALVALFAVALVAANLYVQSQGTQNRLKQELSQRLGMPLRVGRISVTPWGGLSLSGIILGTEGTDMPFLVAKSLHLRVRWPSVFRPPLVITEIVLHQPVVTWPQDSSGRWRWPSPSRTSLNPPAVPAVPRQITVSGSPSTAKAVKIVSAPRRVTSSSFPSAQVKRFRLRDGRFEFLNHARLPIVRFENAQLSAELREDNRARGEARVARIDLRDRFEFAHARTPFVFEDGELSLPQISADLARGKVTGDFAMQTQEPGSPFTAHASLQHVQANDLIVRAGGPADVVRGTLDGAVEMKGDTANIQSLAGAGDLALQAGHVQQFPILAIVGDLLQIEELKQLDLEEAQTKFHVANGNVLIDAMTLRSANLSLSALGSVSLLGKMALTSTLTLNDKIRGQLPRLLRENFTASNQPGFYALDFHVNGTVSKPRTDLMERIVGRDLRDLNGVVDALFGRSHKKKKAAPAETAPPPEVSPAPTEGTPSPTPAPTP